MTPSPIGGSIQIALAPDMGLRQGDLVILHIIKRLEGAKWAVGIGGRVYPATSALSLEAGAMLRARVGTAGGRLVLTVSDVMPDVVRSALERQGLPGGGDAELIARALAQSGLPILAETVTRVRSLLARSAMDPRRGARAAATIIDQRIEPGSAGARALLPVLAFGQKGGEDPRRYRGRQLPDTPHAVKEFIATLPVDPASRPSALQAYNHLRAKTHTWVVIPFVFNAGEQRIAGTMKILFDPFQSRPVAFTMAVEGIGFHLPLQSKKRSLSIFCDDERIRRAAVRALDSLRSKFHNMGLEVDDTVNEGDAFDGFSPVEEGGTLPSVDTVG
jgi:hypothetical protein